MVNRQIQVEVHQKRIMGSSVNDLQVIYLMNYLVEDGLERQPVRTIIFQIQMEQQKLEKNQVSHLPIQGLCLNY